jgi:hypothetical protein
MTDYCASRNQIKTYAPTASASNTLFAKNIDCVTLEANLVACDTLTVQGVDLSGVTDLTTKTQYQTASGNTTTFAGSVSTSALVVNQIGALNATTGVIIPSIIDQTISNAANSITLYLVNPNLGTTPNTMGLHMGTSKATANTAWQMLYVNTSLAGSASNRLDFKMLGPANQSTLSLLNGKLGINNTVPTEALDVTGNAKISGTLTMTGQPVFSTGVNPNRVSVTGNSGTATVQVFGVNTSALRYKVSFYRIASSVNPIVGLRVGTGTTGYQGVAFSYLNSTTTNSDYESTLIPVCGRALGNAGLLSGVVHIEKVLNPSNGYYQFVFSGTSMVTNTTGSEYTINTIAGTLTTTATTAGISQVNLLHLYQSGTFNGADSFLCCEWY